MHRTIAHGAAPRRGGAQNFRWQGLWRWRWARTLAVLGGPVKRDPRAGRESHAGGIFARSRAGARWETCKESRGASISCSGCKVKWTLGCQISEQRLTESPPQKRACTVLEGPEFAGRASITAGVAPLLKTAGRRPGAGAAPERRQGTGAPRQGVRAAPPYQGPHPPLAPGNGRARTTPSDRRLHSSIMKPPKQEQVLGCS